MKVIALLSLLVLFAGCNSSTTKRDVGVQTPKVPAESSTQLFNKITFKNLDFFLPPDGSTLSKGDFNFSFVGLVGDLTSDGHDDIYVYGGAYPKEISLSGRKECDLVNGCTKGVNPVIYVNQGDGKTFLKNDKIVKDERKFPGHIVGKQPSFADFNADGRLDIFQPDHGVNGYRDSYFLSQPDGTFLESSKTHLDRVVPAFSHGSAIGDIDNDGDIDIVVLPPFASAFKAAGNRSFYCYFNDGKGYMTFEWCALRHNVHNSLTNAITLADMDSDGDLDLVAGGNEEGYGKGAFILLNNGRGEFTTKVQVSERVHDFYKLASTIWTYDLDGDGDEDIIRAREGLYYVGAAIEIHENLGDLKFRSTMHAQVKPATDKEPLIHRTPQEEGGIWNIYINTVFFRDTNGDGLIDIILQNQDNSGIFSMGEKGVTHETTIINGVEYKQYGHAGFGKDQVNGAVLQNGGDMKFEWIKNVYSNVQFPKIIVR